MEKEEEKEEEEEEEEETMAGSSGLPPHSRLLAREGGEAEAHLGPPFISDTCHLAPNLHQKWTKMHQQFTDTGFLNLEHLKSTTELAEKREGTFRFIYAYDNCLV